jgi:hypothetical protein
MRPPKAAAEASATTVAWWRCPGVVYFVAAAEPPVAVKIGVAAQTGTGDLKAVLVRRLSQIQSSNHEAVQLLGVIPFTEGEHPMRDAEARERKLHLEFSHLQRFKPNTRGCEWFTAVPELLAQIEQIATPPEALNLPRGVCTSAAGS